MKSRKFLWDIHIITKFVIDIGLSLCSFYLAYYIRFYNKLFTRFIPPIKGIPPIEIYHKFIPYFLISCILSYIFCGNYKKQILRMFDEFVISIKTSFVLLVLLFATSFFYRSYEYSRMFMLLVATVNFWLLFLWHVLITYLYQKYTKYIFGKPKVGFVCSEEKKKKLINLLKHNKSIKKFFLTKFNTKEEILNFINQRKISELVISYEMFSTNIFQSTLAELSLSDIPIKVFVSLPINLSETMIDASLGIPVVSLKPLSLTGLNFFIKRTIDIIVSILVLSISFVPLLFVGYLIFLFDGLPIFFIHKRVGYNGKGFNCVKFRTMVKDAHKMWWDLLKYSERGDKVFKLKNDPRVTPLGRWLRKLSIDEFPQFFNILKGEMSIVGPRPQIVEELSFYDSYSKRRLMVLPGLTGLWQISGRADIGFEEMVDLDLYYLENWSLGLDLEIIVKTIFAVFSKKGAY